MVLSKREIEFEFEHAEDGSGQFLASGNVIATLRDMVAAGNIDEAARFYQGCSSSVAAELLQDLEAGASKRLILQFAEMLSKAKDYHSAGMCAELAGDMQGAAKHHEKAHDFLRSGEFYLGQGNIEKAAQVAERQGAFKRAASLWLKVDDKVRAARNYERANLNLEAAKILIELQRFKQAVLTLQSIPVGADDWLEAYWLMGSVLEDGKRPGLAATVYLTVLRRTKLDKDTVRFYYRLAELYEAGGRLGEAQYLYRRVAEYRSDFSRVQDRLETIEGDEELVDLNESVDSEEVLTTVDAHFHLLGALPIFQELSLDELRMIYTALEKRSFKRGEVLIAKGQPSEALYVVLSGAVRVSDAGPTGAEVIIQELGSGEYLGEMSLVDAGLTSANVVAATSVEVFRLSKSDFIDLIESSDSIAFRFYKGLAALLSRRLRATTQRLTSTPNS